MIIEKTIPASTVCQECEIYLKMRDEESVNTILCAKCATCTKHGTPE